MVYSIFDTKLQSVFKSFIGSVNASQARRLAESKNQAYGSVRYVVLMREPTLEECFK